MTQPIISWTNEDGESLLDNKLNFGIVDAGDIGNDFVVFLWNNKGGEEPVSTMTDCTITTKDSLGGNGTDETLTAASKELILNKWIEVRLTEAGAYNPIGGADNIFVSAEGEVLDEEGNPAFYSISGEENIGDPFSNFSNYSRLAFRANIPPDASSGSVDFLTRVSYRYI